MAEKDVFTIDASRPDLRLDRYLCEVYPNCSRGEIQRLMDEGHVRVNSRGAKPTQTPRAGDVVEIFWPPPKPTEVVAQDIPLDVLFEDKYLLVINKSPALVVHPSAGHEDGTIVNALLHHCRDQLSGVGGVERPGIVHRLDRDTTGCLVVAKSDFAHRVLTDQFALRRVEKHYQCLVCGLIEPPFGDIREPIARHPTQRKRMAIIRTGRSAWTTYRLLEKLADASFVECVLHTGRTHQIRVHLEHLGFPILGDDLYGKRLNARFRETSGFTAPRQMLHARRLSFRHPKTGAWLEVDAPLPADFKEALELLRGKALAAATPDQSAPKRR